MGKAYYAPESLQGQMHQFPQVPKGPLQLDRPRVYWLHSRAEPTQSHPPLSFFPKIVLGIASFPAVIPRTCWLRPCMTSYLRLLTVLFEDILSLNRFYLRCIGDFSYLGTHLSIRARLSWTSLKYPNTLNINQTILQFSRRVTLHIGKHFQPMHRILSCKLPLGGVVSSSIHL